MTPSIHLSVELPLARPIHLAELHIYGNGAQGRVGMYTFNELRRDTLEHHPNLAAGNYYARPLLTKQYELKDHLGNVRVVITDLKKVVGSNWNVDEIAWNNYYPFGMLQPQLHGNTGAYRYGFNGKEMDNEMKENPVAVISGTGNSYDYGARMYNPQLGRWMSIDPLASRFPWSSPYAYVGNTPTAFVDYDGNDYGVIFNHDTKTVTIVATYYYVAGDTRSKNSLEGGLQFWNSQSGKFRYEVPTSTEGVFDEYQINFAFQAVPVPNDPNISATYASSEASEQAIFDEFETLDPMTGEVRTPTNFTTNGFGVIDFDPDDEVMVSKYVNGEVGVSNDKGNVIRVFTILNAHKNPLIVAHELGHSLGLDHLWNHFGVMTKDYLKEARAGIPYMQASIYDFQVQEIILDALNSANSSGIPVGTQVEHQGGDFIKRFISFFGTVKQN